MPAWGWGLAGATGLGFAVIVAGYLTLRSSAAGRRFLALSAQQKVAFGRGVAAHPGLGRPARWVVLALVGYLLLPFDLIPDFLPVIGHVDDVLMVVVAGVLLWILVPRQVWGEVLAQVEGAAGGSGGADGESRRRTEP